MNDKTGMKFRVGDAVVSFEDSAVYRVMGIDSVDKVVYLKLARRGRRIFACRNYRYLTIVNR